MGTEELGRLKGILNTLERLKHYKRYIKDKKKKDSLKNIRDYFNNNIFISIIDYKEKNYDKLFLNSNDFKKYMKNHPEKVASKREYKGSAYRILLRGVYCS